MNKTSTDTDSLEKEQKKKGKCHEAGRGDGVTRVKCTSPPSSMHLETFLAQFID